MKQDSSSHVETVVCLGKKKSKDYVEIGVDAEDYYRIFTISTYNTDYVFTKKENYKKALDDLKSARYEIEE